MRYIFSLLFVCFISLMVYTSQVASGKNQTGRSSFPIVDNGAFSDGFETESQIDILGFSPDNKYMALRIVILAGKNSDIRELKSNKKCKYLKFNGRYMIKSDLYLVSRDGMKKNWPLFRSFSGDNNKHCTTRNQLKKELNAAKKIFKKYKISTEIKGIRINKINKAFTLPDGILKKYSIRDKLYVKNVDCTRGEKDNYLRLCFKLISQKFDSYTIREDKSVTSMCSTYVFKLFYNKEGGSLLYLTNHRGCGIMHWIKGPYEVSLKKLAARLHNNRGLAFHRKKLYKKSQYHFEWAYTIDNGYARAAFNNACALALLNKKEKAIEYLKKTIAINDKYKNSIKKDKDLDSLRSLKEFKELLK